MPCGPSHAQVVVSLVMMVTRPSSPPACQRNLPLRFGTNGYLMKEDPPGGGLELGGQLSLIAVQGEHVDAT